jgi:L,D-transpeptidase catalytic domain
MKARFSSRTGTGGALRGLVAVVVAGSLLTIAASPETVTPNAEPTLAAVNSTKIETRQVKAGEHPVPSDSDRAIHNVAPNARGARIVVSTEKRWLWYMQGKDTLVSAPVAIGMGKTFEYNGKKYPFHTPRGKRVVQAKQANPIWTVPEWHYYEKAAQRGLTVVKLTRDKPYMLDDGTWLDVRGNEVGRVNQFGNWWPFSQDFEITFEGKIFMPPMGTTQRQVTNALGPYKLDLGEGYLIHGTHEDNSNSIGQAVSHGCVRMRNADLGVLYELVSPGTPVFIY